MQASVPNTLIMIALLLSLLGCRGSTKDIPGAVGDTRVEIHVEQLSDRRDSGPLEVHRIFAVLRNKKGAAIENPAIRVTANGTPMRFHVWSGNYYDRHPSYRLEEGDGFSPHPETDYVFEIQLPDGNRQRAGSVRTPGKIDGRQLVVPAKHPRNRELTIEWKDIGTEAELSVLWTPVPVGANGEVGDDGKPLVDDVRKKKLGPGFLRSRNGKLVIPATEFALKDGRRPTDVNVTVRAEIRGELTSGIALPSQIDAVRLLTYHVELTD